MYPKISPDTVPVCGVKILVFESSFFQVSRRVADRIGTVLLELLCS